MKQLHQTLKVFLLISIYCFGIFVTVTTAPFPSTQTVEQNNKKNEYFSSVSKVLYIHRQQSESLLSTNTESLTPNFNLFYKGFWVILVSSELLFKNKYKQYQNYFKNLLIRNRKSDLLFPFHNFW